MPERKLEFYLQAAGLDPVEINNISSAVSNEDFIKSLDKTKLSRVQKADAWEIRYGNEALTEKLAPPPSLDVSTNPSVESTSHPQGGFLWRRPMVAKPLMESVKEHSEYLPPVMAGLGALSGTALAPGLGPLGPFLGATVGGAGGGALRRIVRNENIRPIEDVWIPGAEQGSIEAFGGALTAGGRALLGPASRWYGRSLKGKVKPPELLPKVVDLQREKGILTSEEGLRQAADIVKVVKSKINAGIDALESQGITIQGKDVLNIFDNLWKEKQFSPARTSWQRAINRVQSDTMQALGIKRRRLADGTIRYSGLDVPIARAQKFKQEGWKDLKTVYEKTLGASPKASIVKQVLDDATRAAKKAIENVWPEIRGLNATEQQAIGLRDSIKDVIQEMLYGPGMLREAAHGAAGVLHFGSPTYWAEAGVFKRLIEHPTLQSAIGKGLDIWRNKINPIRFPNILRTAHTVAPVVFPPEE